MFLRLLHLKKIFVKGIKTSVYVHYADILILVVNKKEIENLEITFKNQTKQNAKKKTN